MKRTVALGAAWTASAAAAVGLGFLAVSFVDASASPGTQPVAASTTESAGATPDDSEVRGTPSASPTSTGSPRSATGEYATAGGTVYANCTAGRPVVAGVPATGWWVDDSNEPGKIEFERASQEVEVRVSCVGGSPVFVLDDATRSSSPASFSSAPATETSGRDDHDDGGNSGHGGGGDDRDDSDNSGHGGGDDDSSGRGGSDDD